MNSKAHPTLLTLNLKKKLRYHRLEERLVVSGSRWVNEARLTQNLPVDILKVDASVIGGAL